MSAGIEPPNVADWVTAIAAVLGLGLVFAQIRHNTRLAAIETAREFITESRERWAECVNSAGSNPFDVDKFRRDLAQLIAHLELSVAAISEMSFPETFHDMIEKTIISFLKQMINASYDGYILEIFSDAQMCPCLRSFTLQRISLFEDRDRIMKAMAIETCRYR
ncbi:hypothetical protein [Brevundimonas sp.]|uniref:hypothetical protein n=1 Tax=Brevundimonas sp. TaxID=1871086 RepID=UPI0035ADF851